MTSYSGYQPGGAGPRTAGGRPGAFRRFGRGRKVCAFCVEKVQAIDYKSANRLRRYLSDRSRIESGKRTGTCARHQRMLRLAIKRARTMGLLPFCPDHLRVTGPVSVGGRGPHAAQAAEGAAAAAEAEDAETSEEAEESDTVEEDVPQAEDTEPEDEKS